MVWTILEGLAALLSVTTGSAGNRQQDLKGLTSPELSSLEERGDVELLQPTNEVRETIKSPVSAGKDTTKF